MGLIYKSVKLFQCSGHFKCPSHYCIPYDYICDGKWDCPNGEDEVQCKSFSCPKLFKCKNETKCLSLTKVCNKISDCIKGEDEKSCGLTFQNVDECPTKCTCITFSAVCSSFSNGWLSVNWTYLFHFKCFSCALIFSNTAKIVFEKLLIFNLKNGSILQTCNSCLRNVNFPILEVLDVSENVLTFMANIVLLPFKSIRQLHIQKNAIYGIQDNSFYAMANLKYIDLSLNKISLFTSKTFNGLKSIIILNLSYNNIISIDQKTFNNMQNYVVVSDMGRICCLSGIWANCKVQIDTLSNCDDLIPNVIFGALTWVIAILIIVMNLISLYVHLQKSSPKAFIVIVLSIVDLFYGMYLIMIKSVDTYYKDLHIEFSYIWKNSFMCRLLAFISLYSWLCSPILLLVIMTARFSIIRWPMTSYFMKIVAVKQFVAIFVIIVFISYLLTFLLLYCPQ